MRCASVIFSFELSSEGIRTFAKGPEEECWRCDSPVLS